MTCYTTVHVNFFDYGHLKMLVLRLQVGSCGHASSFCIGSHQLRVTWLDLDWILRIVAIGVGPLLSLADLVISFFLDFLSLTELCYRNVSRRAVVNFLLEISFLTCI